MTIANDVVRRDFIAAYASMWKCSLEYAENMLRHVEIAAVKEEISDAQVIRAMAEDQQLYNPSWFEGWDDAIARVTPTE